MIFVDTNYFLRFLLRDNETQHKQVRQLFESGARSEAELVTSVIVFFEIYWVLRSFYGKQKEEISTILNGLLDMKFIDFENETLLHKAIQRFGQSGVSLPDAYNLEYAKRHKAAAFATFDEKLAKLFSNVTI